MAEIGGLWRKMAEIGGNIFANGGLWRKMAENGGNKNVDFT